MMDEKLQKLEDDLNRLQQSFSRFQSGLFVQCKSLATQVTHQNQLSPLTEWVAENSILSSEFELMTMQKKHKECRELHLKFRRLLKKVQSLLVSEESAELELCVLYNCLQSDTASDHWSALILDSLERMQINENKIKGVQGFQGLVQKLSWDTKILAGVRSISVLWAGELIRYGNIKTAHQILTSLLTLTGGTSTLRERTAVEFAVRLHQGSPPLTDEDTETIMYILLASCYLATEKSENCREIIGKVKMTKFKTLSIYIKALSLYKDQRATDAITALQALAPADLESTEACLRARIHCLTGRCLSRLGKPRTAIHHLKAALEADFRYTVALYYIAVEYKHLCMESAELEALNLLIMTLENTNSASDISTVTLDEQVSSIVIKLLDLPYTVTVVQVQYLLAARCLELHRYEAAYQRYMDLLAVIMKSDVIQCEGTLIQVPRLCQVFLEAIQSSLKCKRLEECVTLCDQSLLSGPLGDTSDRTPPPADPQTSTDHTGGKRKRMPSSPEIDGEDSSANHTTACLLYKAEALQFLGELEDAAQTLHRAADRLEKRLSEVTEDRTEGNSDHKQRLKRARLSPGLEEQIPPENPCVTLSQVYERLGRVSSQQNKHSKALHYYRMSLQLQKDNETTTYFLTKELFVMNRFQEAVSIWLESRKISPKMDSFQVDREIQTRETKLKNISAEILDVRPNESDLLGMDVKVLKTLLHHRQTHVWRVR